MCKSVGYFTGLTHLFFYKSICQVLIRLSVQAFIFTNGNDKKHSTNGAKKGFEVLDKSIGVRQALNPVLALPFTSWLSWRFA